jgi:hypothetical protein
VPTTHQIIAEAIGLAAKALDRLAKEPGPKEPEQSTWDDWNLRDVFVHLSAWAEFATHKVAAIRDGKPFDEVDDLGRFNRAAYDRGVGLTLAQARKNWQKDLKELGAVAARFSNAELDKESWPTGFPMTLARYVVMDAYVHPLQHILYHALKTGRDETFLDTLGEAGTVLDWYRPGMDILGSFGDFFQGESARWRFFGAVDSHAFPPPIQDHIRELGSSTPPR